MCVRLCLRMVLFVSIEYFSKYKIEITRKWNKHTQTIKKHTLNAKPNLFEWWIWPPNDYNHIRKFQNNNNSEWMLHIWMLIRLYSKIGPFIVLLFSESLYNTHCQHKKLHRNLFTLSFLQMIVLIMRNIFWFVLFWLLIVSSDKMNF